jgi:GH25 family lysozyme M1 (1,4-beta-N-acetylmuramidase)
MTIFGWDQSHFDAPSIGTAVAEGISFITHKAGGDATDTELPAWWAGVRGLDPGKVLLGAYWVLYPGNPVGRADAFIARLDAACPGWRDRPFILQADCEEWNNDPTTVPNRTEIGAFCDRLQNRMPKLKPIVYAPKWVYGDRLTGLGYPLWGSSYVTGSGSFRALYPGDRSSHWGAHDEILQYSSSATIGGQTTCDANAFRGTLDQLTALVAPGWSDDVSKQDVLDGLGEFFARKTDPKDGAVTSEIGRDALDQGIPNGLAGGKRTTAWQAIHDLGEAVAAIQATLAAQPAVDIAALAATVTSGLLAVLSPEVIAALPADFAAQVAGAVAGELAKRLTA